MRIRIKSWIVFFINSIRIRPSRAKRRWLKKEYAAHVATAGLAVAASISLGASTSAAQCFVRQDFTAGGARFAKVGDFNGDGIEDIATANEFSDGVSVLLGNGDGTFAQHQIFAVGDRPNSVATDDFNGDGMADLATANRDSNDVSVLLGNGDGTFAPQQSFTAGNAPLDMFGPRSVTTGDFNGDGLPDLLTVNELFYYVGEAVVLLGNGDGTFAPQLISPLGWSVSSVTTSDFNGDGFLDIATANDDYFGTFAGPMTVLLGNGDGTFGSEQAYTDGGPDFITAGDFNGDGLTDLVTVDGNFYFTGEVSVFLGNGDGTFAPRKNFLSGIQPYSVAPGDFNGDGLTDLATLDLDPDFSLHEASVWLGNGDGTFTPNQNILVGGAPRSIVSGDFNGDGQIDLATASGGISVLLNQCGTGGSITCLYEDPDPDQDSPEANGLDIVGVAGRTYGEVSVNGDSNSNPFKTTGVNNIDVSLYRDIIYRTGFDVFVPSDSPINDGDRIYLQCLFHNRDNLDTGDPNTFVRTTSDVVDSSSARNTWLRAELATDRIPSLTPAGNSVDSVNVAIVVTDGGFGGTPNDSGGGVFCRLDEFSFLVNPPGTDPITLYEDLDPDQDSPENNGLIIAGAGGEAFGAVTVSGDPNSNPFKTTGVNNIDVSPYLDITYRTGFDVFVPTDSPINDGDRIYLQCLFHNRDNLDSGDPSTFVRTISDIVDSSSARNTWLRSALTTDRIPSLTPAGDSVDSVNVAIVVADGGFGGAPNDSGGGVFCFIDEFSFCVDVPNIVEFVPPGNYTVFRGNEISGNVSAFAESDNTTANYNPGFVLNDLEAPVWLVFTGNAPGSTDFQIESQAGTPGLAYTVELWNYNTSAFDEIGVEAESFNNDTVFNFPLTGSDHIAPNGNVRSRVGWRQSGFIINFPWEVRVDQIGWN